MPPGFNTRQVLRTIASNCVSFSAKCSTALAITTSAAASGKLIDSTASTRKFASGRSGASRDANARTDSTATGSRSHAATSKPLRRKYTRLRPPPQPASMTRIAGAIRPRSSWSNR
jgi:hypothetical protein